MNAFDIQQTMQLAVQQHEAGRLAEAETLYRRVLQQDPQHIDALHLLGLVAHQQGHHAAALELIGRALRINDRFSDFHLNLGLVYQALQRPDEAVLSYQRALALKPDEAMAHYNLGNVYSGQGRMEQAIAHLQQAVALKRDYVEAWFNLGNARILQDEVDAAVACYRQVIAINPAMPEVQNNLGNALSRQGRLEEALVHFRQALALRPDFPEALGGLAGALIARGEPEEAMVCCQRALALKPDYARAYAHLGNACSNLGRLVEAEAAFRQALALQPEFAEACFNLGNTLGKLGKFEEAVACYEKVLTLNARHIDDRVYCNLGVALIDLGLPEQAMGCFQRVLTRDPESIEAYCNLGTAVLKMGRPDEALTYFERALTLDPSSAPSHSNVLLALQYVAATTPERVVREQRAYAQRFEAPLIPFWPVPANDRDPERRLRVGYVSPDFRNHSVARFLAPILAHHDRRQVEVTGYYTHTIEDAFTDRIRGYLDHWRACKGLSDPQMIERIRADGIDLLVDLAGHTADNRLPVFAHKPAPVQVTYLGYPGSTGLTAMDYRLVTADTDPPGNEAWHSERLYRLPRTLWCYRPPADTPQDVGQTPALVRGHITFGSMNAFAKISPETLALWGEVLRAIPGSRLLMTSVPAGATRDRLLQCLAAHGVTAARVTLHGRLPAEDFRALSRDIDLALDPFPYAGTTTTCEALWMGIPVITLVGQTSVSRSGYALLKSVGLEELCASNEADYVRLAVELAADHPRLNALRQGMRQRLDASPLRDEAGLARDIEQAYRTMWREWCARP